MTQDLTVNQERAAPLMADDTQTDAQIGQVCGVAEHTIECWRKAPAVAARIAERPKLHGGHRQTADADRPPEPPGRVDGPSDCRARKAQAESAPTGRQDRPTGASARGKHIVFEGDTGLRAHELQRPRKRTSNQANAITAAAIARVKALGMPGHPSAEHLP